jgi:hypothetical protein
MKSGDLPASSRRTTAQTLPEWEEIHDILSGVMSGWVVVTILLTYMSVSIGFEIPTGFPSLAKFNLIISL